jgi:hypothetical protein
MVISADFEKQKQYFDKKYCLCQKVIALLKYCFIAISLYHNIACKNSSSDEGLRTACCFQKLPTPNPNLIVFIFVLPFLCLLAFLLFIFLFFFALRLFLLLLRMFRLRLLVRLFVRACRRTFRFRRTLG